MASTREERLAQRLRGAQRHQNKDVDFGLVFPIPSVPEQDQAPQTTPSPAPESLEHDQEPQPENRPITSHTTIDANTSVKRRKLDNGAHSASSSTRRSTRLSPRGREDIYTLRDDSPPAIPSESRSTPLPLATRRLPITERDLDASADLSSNTPAVPLPDSDDVDYNVVDDTSSRNSMNVDMLEQEQPLSPVDLAVEELVEMTPVPLENHEDELSPEQPKRSGRKRNRQDFHDEAQESETLSIQESKQRLQRSQPLEASMLEVEEDASEVAEAVDDEEAAIQLTKNRGTSTKARGKSDTAKRTPVVASVPSLVKSKKPKKPRRKASPARQRQPKKDAPQKGDKSSKANKTAQWESIPVTVHRFTKETSYDVEVLDSHIPFAKRGGVNAIDVLSQVCHEVVNSGLTTLQEGAESAEDPALRKEYKTKWRALEGFGRELQTRLLEHTINLDTTYALERRVRKEQTEKLKLRESVMQVRHEREQVALRMDEVRIKHETESYSFQALDTLNTTLHDVELAVERGRSSTSSSTRSSKTHPGDMLEVGTQLKRLAGEVSDKGASGGILKQIKDFNAFLERAALALEARKT